MDSSPGNYSTEAKQKDFLHKNLSYNLMDISSRASTVFETFHTYENTTCVTISSAFPVAFSRAEEWW